MAEEHSVKSKTYLFISLVCVRTENLDAKEAAKL